MVLPFSALEMTALLACLYYCVRRTHEQEVLTFSVDELIVEKGHRAPEHTYHFSRFFTRFHVEPAAHPWYQDRIAVQMRDQRVEIGRFLTPEEKDQPRIATPPDGEPVPLSTSSHQSDGQTSSDPLTRQ